jgi:WD40 repeat protein
MMALAWFLGAAPVVSAQDRGDKPRGSSKSVSFINDVAPILKENCFACHDAKKRAGKFEMTTFEKLMKGGAQSDTPVVAGKPDDSDLYTLIVSEAQRRMPPRDKGEAVPPEKAAVIARWIEQGAKLDAGLDPKADLLRELRVRWQPPSPPAKYPYPVIVTALAFTPDGKQLVVGGHHELTVWDFAAGKLVKRLFTRAERAHALAFLPDGKLVVAGGRPGQEGDVRVYDLSAKPAREEGGVAILDGVKDPKVMLQQLLDTDDSVLCLAVSPDGKKLAAGGCDRIVRVWDIGGGVLNAKLEQSIENHADWVLGVAFAPDGKHLLSASRDKTAKVWDLAAKESVLTFPDHQQPVFGVAVKPDGSTGYSVGADKQLRAWKVAGEGKQMKNAGGHGNDVYQVFAVPKQPWLVTCSGDSTVRLWNAESLAGLRTLSGLSDHVYAVAVSPDGSLVAAGSYKGEVAVWQAADGKAVKQFNASPGYAPPAPAAAVKK